MDATIEDVLRFRRALTFMDEFYPFGVDFGPASTRDESISSAEAVYSKLCKLGKESGRLPFSTLALIAMEEDETYDDVKKRALRRLFHPDADKTLTLLAFVQSCDTIYRRLRYFLATVNNSASLDKVLENAIDGIYYFVLGLFLMSLMNYNAWSLLVSLTSLLVSFSFAFGQTVSKYVQGIILIAVTRPFDLGDRIFLTPAGEVAKELENAGNTWFVEDITLSSTKMRYARTGEVAYLSNHLMSDMRIYNCNRSPNAIVVIQHILKIAILDSDYYDRFKKAMRQFVSDRPRMWVELLVMRADKIDSDMEQVFLTMQFRHRNSWQDAPRIFLQRSELLRFIHETSKKMNLSFETPPPRRVLYYGGQLEQGAVEDSHRTDLLTSANVRNNSERSGMGMPPLDKM
jgi:small-conductance mechanosensitive channel